MNHAAVQLIWREEWELRPADFIKGLLPGVRLDVYFAGFPTLKHVKHTVKSLFVNLIKGTIKIASNLSLVLIRWRILAC